MQLRYSSIPMYHIVSRWMQVYYKPVGSHVNAEAKWNPNVKTVRLRECYSVLVASMCQVRGGHGRHFRCKKREMWWALAISGNKGFHDGAEWGGAGWLESFAWQVPLKRSSERGTLSNRSLSL